MNAPPGYWMNETTGVLRPVVERYLHGQILTAAEVAVMRAYLRQWIAADWPGVGKLRARIDTIVTHDDVDAWLDDALDRGIDPL